MVIGPHDLLHVVLSYGMDRDYITVWLYSPTGLIKMIDAFYLLKHRKKIFKLLVHTTHSKLVLMQIYVTFRSLCIFQEETTGQDPNEDY